MSYELTIMNYSQLHLSNCFDKVLQTPGLLSSQSQALIILIANFLVLSCIEMLEFIVSKIVSSISILPFPEYSNTLGIMTYEL